MRSPAVQGVVVIVFLGAVFTAAGGDAANWWRLPIDGAGLDCTRGRAACQQEQSLGAAFALLGVGFWLLAVLLNLRWAARRARARRIRRHGVRVPARLVHQKRPGDRRGHGVYKQRWRAVLPDGSTTEWTVRNPAGSRPETWLEAAAVGDDAVLILDLHRRSVARDIAAVAASAGAAAALLRARGDAKGAEEAEYIAGFAPRALAQR